MEPDDDGGLQWWQTDGQWQAEYEQWLDKVEAQYDRDADLTRNDFD